MEKLGIKYSLIEYEALVDENSASKAVRKVEISAVPQTGVYRGWMLKPTQYNQLYHALAERGIRLINSPTQYLQCHYLPEWYPLVVGYTPASVWLGIQSGLSMAQISELLVPFGDKPVIVKDFVKSRKHEWLEACFIPSASDRQSVERVVKRFLELQGSDLNGGLVFREFLQFEPLSVHSKSGLPLTKEYRIFFLDQNPIYWVRYWDEGEYDELIPPVEQFMEIVHQIGSRFFTMDIVRQVNGKWIIVELGDGQVSGLPDKANFVQFYQALLVQLTS